MKNNIIYFKPEEGRQEKTRKGSWIRIENDAVFGLIDSLLVLWLGAWSLYAGIEFLRATRLIVF